MFDVGGWVCAAAFASQESTLRANVAAAQERAAAAAAAAGPGGSPTRGVRGGGGEHWGRGGAGRSPERVQRLTLEPRRGGGWGGWRRRLGGVGSCGGRWRWRGAAGQRRAGGGDAAAATRDVLGGHAVSRGGSGASAPAVRSPSPPPPPRPLRQEKRRPRALPGVSPVTRGHSALCVASRWLSYG
eukprot:COSAG01_NODE_325_length_18790_cov_64.371101_2_plen_185_part_00